MCRFGVGCMHVAFWSSYALQSGHGQAVKETPSVNSSQKGAPQSVSELKVTPNICYFEVRSNLQRRVEMETYDPFSRSVQQSSANLINSPDGLNAESTQQKPASQRSTNEAPRSTGSELQQSRRRLRTSAEATDGGLHKPGKSFYILIIKVKKHPLIYQIVWSKMRGSARVTTPTQAAQDL